MTIVVGLGNTVDAVVLADCRLTYSPPSGAKIRRDVCAKLVVANGWSAVGFSGDLCLPRHLLGGVVSRLRATNPENPDWLKDDQKLLDFVAEGVHDHAGLGPNHRACGDRAQLLIAWMDYSRSILTADTGAEEALFVPGAWITVVRTPERDVRRTGLGLDIIGTPSIAPRMRAEAHRMLLHFARGAEHGDAHRALLATQVVRDLLADKGGAPGVGGLFQIATLSARGVATVPYFYLAPVEPGYRTYVAMRVEGGEWVQEHRPTGTVVPVVSPFAIDPFAPPGGHAMFDPALMLTRDSPGVVPQMPTEVAFSIYDPANVGPAIRASWGDEPLAPLTWAGE